MGFKMQELPLADRPYEKLEVTGAKALTDTELLAILLGSGQRNNSALDLARHLMRREGGLKFVREASLEELRQLAGIGRVKSLRLKAAVELSKRWERRGSETVYPLILEPQDAISLMEQDLCDLPHEEFHILLLDTRGRLIRKLCMGTGGLTATVVYPRDVFREAVKANAASLILCHNHPSGDASPSEADIELSKRFAELGQLMGIKILDHIVIGQQGSRSLKSEGCF